MTIKSYEGTRCGDQAVVLVRIIDSEGAYSYHLPHVVRHSPDGFNWGYRGSGPADLARSILVDLAGTDPEPGTYHAFKDHFLAGLDTNCGWSIAEDEIRCWLRDRA